MTREKLFAAIEEGRFDAVPSLAAECREHLLAQLAPADPQSRVRLFTEGIQPFEEALHLLRIVRAHCSTQYQQLALQPPYCSPLQLRRGQSLNLDG